MPAYGRRWFRRRRTTPSASIAGRGGRCAAEWAQAQVAAAQLVLLGWLDEQGQQHGASCRSSCRRGRRWRRRFGSPTAPTPPLPPPTPTWRRVWWAQEEGAAAQHSPLYPNSLPRARPPRQPAYVADGDESADGSTAGACAALARPGGNESGTAGTDSVGMDGFFSSDAADDESRGSDGQLVLGPDGQPLLRKRRYYRKTLRPTPSQLASLGLKLGANTITFSVHSALQGTQAVASRLFLFESSCKLVISDVDGTITKSDVLGHLMPRVGYDWAHLGVTSLYSRITSNGYQMLYLTARGIGMAGTTRDYLASIVRAGRAALRRALRPRRLVASTSSKAESKLPDGPCLLSRRV